MQAINTSTKRDKCITEQSKGAKCKNKNTNKNIKYQKVQQYIQGKRKVARWRKTDNYGSNTKHPILRG